VYRAPARQAGALQYMARCKFAGLGTTSVVLDAQGDKVAESRHLPYGGERWRWPEDGTFPIDYRFTGQRFKQPLGIYTMGARWYDPYIARWISPDSIVPNPLNPQDFNRYSYVAGNPLGFIDPSGHFKLPTKDNIINAIRKIPGYETTANNLDMALTIVQHPEASVGEKILAGGYIATEAIAHGALAVGTGILGWEAVGAVAGAAAGGEAIATAGTATTAACADGDCTNEARATQKIIETGWTVIGKYPQYLSKARELGANVFNIAIDEWNALGSRAAQWAKNVEFLDEAIARGDSFRLATPFAQGWAERGTFYKDELVYLLQKGYELVTDVNGIEWLVKMEQ
jgi:RHS repeat-associated protein